MNARNYGAHRADPAKNRTLSAPGRKNRRRWCRGKPGREHQWEPAQKWDQDCVARPYWKHLTYSTTIVICYEIVRCASCGREHPIPERDCRLAGDRSCDGQPHPYAR